MRYLFFIFLSFSTLLYSQELNCKVTVNYQNLPTVNRELLVDFASVIEDYMNKTRFTGDNWDGPKINCNIQIFFQSASSEISYTAQTFWGSQRPVYKSTNNSQMLSVMDVAWSFNYERGQALYYNPSVFESITSYLNYYAFLIIGLDFDSYDKLAGTPFYAKAYDIVNQGASSGYSNGWLKSSLSYSRHNVVDDLLNEKYRPFREAFFDYHYNGIDLYATDKAQAQESFVKMVKTLETLRTKIDLNGALMKTFFDTKHGEIIDHLKDYPDKEVFKLLRKIDPQHAAKYDSAMKG